MRIVGITGGIGSGKSQIAAFFELLTVPVYNSDDRAKELMSTDAALVAKIIALFGAEAYTNKQLNRAFIAERAFHNPELLTQLNQSVHPVVAIDFKEWVGKQTSDYVLKESALLVETGAYTELDQLITVSLNQEERMRRVLSRDPHRDKSAVLAIMDKQLTDHDREKHADYVLKNDNSSLLIPELLRIHEELRSI